MGGEDIVISTVIGMLSFVALGIAIFLIVLFIKLIRIIIENVKDMFTKSFWIRMRVSITRWWDSGGGIGLLVILFIIVLFFIFWLTGRGVCSTGVVDSIVDWFDSIQ